MIAVTSTQKCRRSIVEVVKKDSRENLWGFFERPVGEVFQHVEGVSARYPVFGVQRRGRAKSDVLGAPNIERRHRDFADVSTRLGRAVPIERGSQCARLGESPNVFVDSARR